GRQPALEEFARVVRPHGLSSEVYFQSLWTSIGWPPCEVWNFRSSSPCDFHGRPLSISTISVECPLPPPVTSADASSGTDVTLSLSTCAHCLPPHASTPTNLTVDLTVCCTLSWAMPLSGDFSSVVQVSPGPTGVLA